MQKPKLRSRKNLKYVDPPLTQFGKALSDNFIYIGDGLESSTSHNNNTSNPHNITSSQIGAAALSHTHLIADITNAGSLALLDTVGTDEINANAVTISKFEKPLLHTAIEDEDDAFQLQVDAAGFGGVRAIDIDYKSGTLGSGDDDEVVLVSIDETLSTGGRIVAYEVITTAEGVAEIDAVEVGVQVHPVIQQSGSFVDAGLVDDNGTNETITLSSGGAGNIAILTNTSETLTIGDLAKFSEIEVILGTPSSNPGVAPTFEYSTGVGMWASFTPADGTNQFRVNGAIVWLLTDIPGWLVGTGGNFLIKITRTRNNVSTTPIANLIQIAAAVIYCWDKDGRAVVNKLELGLGDGEAGNRRLSVSGGLIKATNTSDVEGPYISSASIEGGGGGGGGSAGVDEVVGRRYAASASTLIVASQFTMVADRMYTFFRPIPSGKTYAKISAIFGPDGTTFAAGSQAYLAAYTHLNGAPDAKIGEILITDAILTGGADVLADMTLSLPATAPGIFLTVMADRALKIAMMNVDGMSTLQMLGSTFTPGSAGSIQKGSVDLGNFALGQPDDDSSFQIQIGQPAQQIWNFIFKVTPGGVPPDSSHVQIGATLADTAANLKTEADSASPGWIAGTALTSSVIVNGHATGSKWEFTTQALEAEVVESTPNVGADYTNESSIPGVAAKLDPQFMLILDPGAFASLPDPHGAGTLQGVVNSAAAPGIMLEP